MKKRCDLSILLGEKKQMAKNEKEYKEQTGGDYWKPSVKDDQIEGKIVSINDGDYGKQYVIEQENGDKVTTPSHRVLQSRMSEAKVGDECKIIFNGTEAPSVKGRNPTSLYQVFLR